jgi:hypothetical protein
MTNTTGKKSQGLVDCPDEGDYQQTILGLRGVLSALSMLIRWRVADGAMSQEYIERCIDELIVAGEQLADEVAGRF